ncbi:MAG: hypothetical protein GF315_05570 [candidate division Zixibacteria bacterium]|nr:hypothetical protein [candidate division Zixibacteria bacterium]
MLHFKDENASFRFFKQWDDEYLKSMTLMDEYPNGNLYYYHNQKSSLPDLWIFSGQGLMIIARCQEGDTRKIIFKRLVNWIYCTKRGDFDSCNPDNRPCYAAKVDPVTKKPQIACCESGQWTKLVDHTAIENASGAESQV